LRINEWLDNLYSSLNFQSVSQIPCFENLVENGISISINMVVNQLNKNQVYETGKFLDSLGIRVFCATPASPCEYIPPDMELTREEVVNTLDDLLRLREDLGMIIDVVEPLPRCIVEDTKKYEHFFRRDCAAGKMTVAISPSGDVRPCTHVSKMYGNLLQEDLSSIWQKMREWRDGSFIPVKCNDCAELPVCSLGCREAANIKKGAYNEIDPWAKDVKIPSKNRKIIKESTLDESAELEIENAIKFRREKGGYAIFCPISHSVAYVNKPFFNLLVNLKSRGIFTLDSLKRDFKEPEKAKLIVKYLNSRGLIKQ